MSLNVYLILWVLWLVCIVGLTLTAYDCEAPVLKMEKCRVPSLSGLLWPGRILPFRVPWMDQIELFDYLLRILRNIPQVPLSTLSVMFFPRSLGISGLSTPYTFARVTKLVLISHQFVVKNLTAAKKQSLKIYKALYKIAPAEHPIKCVSGQSLSHKKRQEPN